MSYSSLGRCPTLISHNLRGLNVPEKRISFLRELKKSQPAFVLIQEIHFYSQTVPRRFDRHFPEVFHAPNPDRKSKGVSILLHKHAYFKVTHQLADPQGRFLFLKGTWHNRQVTLANAYFPNSGHLAFCRRLVDELKGFATGCIILGGDFNIPLCPLQDTAYGKSSIFYSILQNI